MNINRKKIQKRRQTAWDEMKRCVIWLNDCTEMVCAKI